VGPKVIVVGVGGIGGVLASTWVKAGRDSIFLVTPNARVREAWANGEVTLHHEVLPYRLPREQILERLEDAPGLFDLAFLAVQPDQLGPSLELLAPRLSPSAEVVTLTNGLCDEQVGRAVGLERAVGAVVMWGARMPKPGVYVRTSTGGFVIGKLPGAEKPVTELALELLSEIGPPRLTSNLLGARFSKLALNAAISTLGTIGGETLGKLLLHEPCRELALRIVEEAVAVAHAEGIRLESVTPLDMEWLADGLQSGALGRWLRHLSLLMVGFRYRRLRSSMLAAVERGRAPAVGYLNGEIVRRGELARVPTPLNAAARDLVWKIAEGQTEAGQGALYSLALRGRASP
jgi:2-dehydropantoate 2-reductase